MNYYSKNLIDDKVHVLTKKEQVIVNDFVKVFKKHKKKISPLRMVELVGVAIDGSRKY